MKFYDREKEKKVLGEVLLQSKHDQNIAQENWSLEPHWFPLDVASVHFFYFLQKGLHFAPCLWNKCSHTREFLFPRQAANFVSLSTMKGYSKFVKLYSLRS